MKRFPVFHVPHDGTEFPDELMVSACVARDEFRRYHERMRDRAVREMVPRRFRNEESMVLFSVSRLLCDVERFIGPAEIMERFGMGYCYERAYDGRRIKTVTPDLLRLTRVYYDQHHERLDQLCREHESVLLLDMHSYSDGIVLPAFLKGDQETPDVCVGADARYTPDSLTEYVAGVFRQAGYTVAVNYPYSGCLVPNAVMAGKCACDCASIMLEFNKRIYCDREEREDPNRIHGIRQLVDRILDHLI